MNGQAKRLVEFFENNPNKEVGAIQLHRVGSGKEFDYRPMEGAGDLGDGLDSAFKDPKPSGGRKPARPHLQSVKDHDDEPFS